MTTRAMSGGTYLLEAYLSKTCAGDTAAVVARARSAVEQMAWEGTPIRLLRSFFLPEDELCFCLYEARSIEEVAEAGRRAEMRFGRIQPAVELLRTRNQAERA
jgi:hypothetical protein